MQDILEQLIDYLKGIWIKRRYIIIATWLILPLGWFFVAKMPNVYESNARVYADTQSILDPLLKGLTVETNPNTQIRLMIKTLLSRPNLERIARMTDLDVQAKTPAEFEEIIEHLKEHIIIKRTGGRKDNLFTIAYEDKNPELAKNVVQSALTVFIENTLGENRTDADSAQKFLDSQIAEYENRLAAAEARLTDFKQKYSNILPNQAGGFYSQLNTAKEKLKAIELELLEAQTRLNSAKAQLNFDTNTIKDPENKIKSDNSIKTTYDERIAELETALDSLQLRYTDKHPDVKEVKRRLEHLNKQRAQEIDKYLAASTDQDASIRRITQSPVMQEVQIQVNQLENEVASLKVRADSYRQTVKVLEGKIHTLPEIEAELVALNRGYEITKSKYEELLNRKETAQLAEQADKNTSNIQFKIIDPPRIPVQPSGPKRILFFIVVTVIGIGVGVGLSLLMSQISPVATSSVQLSKATGIPMFGSVSASEKLGLQAWHRKKTIIFMISNLLLTLVLAVFVAYFLFPELIPARLQGFLNL
jgi:polysaccharide chain length determinant protein (PEP-CTERM system associated)